MDQQEEKQNYIKEAPIWVSMCLQHLGSFLATANLVKNNTEGHFCEQMVGKLHMRRFTLVQQPSI